MFFSTIITVNVHLNVMRLFDNIPIIFSRSDNGVGVTPNLYPRPLVWHAAKMLVKNITNLGDLCVDCFLIHKLVASRANDPKLSHGHRRLTHACNNDVQSS